MYIAAEPQATQTPTPSAGNPSPHPVRTSFLPPSFLFLSLSFQITHSTHPHFIVFSERQIRHRPDHGPLRGLRHRGQPRLLARRVRPARRPVRRARAWHDVAFQQLVRGGFFFFFFLAFVLFFLYLSFFIHCYVRLFVWLSAPSGLKRLPPFPCASAREKGGWG